MAGLRPWKTPSPARYNAGQVSVILLSLPVMAARPGPLCDVAGSTFVEGAQSRPRSSEVRGQADPSRCAGPEDRLRLSRLAVRIRRAVAALGSSSTTRDRHQRRPGHPGPVVPDRMMRRRQAFRAPPSWPCAARGRSWGRASRSSWAFTPLNAVGNGEANSFPHPGGTIAAPLAPLAPQQRARAEVVATRGACPRRHGRGHAEIRWPRGSGLWRRVPLVPGPALRYQSLNTCRVKS
jgi:hypothetical protein